MRKQIEIECNCCKKSFLKDKSEYKRQKKKGNENFYCSKDCLKSNIKPSKYTIVNAVCGWCGGAFATSTDPKKNKSCCNKTCSAKLSQSYVTPEHYDIISKKLSKSPCCKRSGEGNKSAGKRKLFSYLFIQTCISCNQTFTFYKAKLTCSQDCFAEFRRLKDRSFPTYRRRCKFEFALNSFPDEFEFELITKHGWYKPKNRGDNLGGVSRDHMVSARFGYDNNIDPEIIKHPANCKLMKHGDNVRKYTDSSITLEELKQRILDWDKKYPSLA